MKVAFIGLGHMGEAMARNLLRAGSQLTVFNRTRSKTEALRGEGAVVADSPAEAVAGAEFLITMLADDNAVRAAVWPALEALAPGAMHVGSSTISVALSRELDAAHRLRGQKYVAAPIVGRPDAAAQKQLLIIAAGPSSDLDRCRPVFDAYARVVSVVGPEPWMANLCKIAFNFVLASMIESFGESFALIEKAGVDVRRFAGVLGSSPLRSPAAESYAARILDKSYQPAGFSMALGLKDTQLALESGAEEAVPMPFAGVLRDHYLAALAHGNRDLDWSAIAEVSRQVAGLGKPLSAGG